VSKSTHIRALRCLSRRLASPNARQHHDQLLRAVLLLVTTKKQRLLLVIHLVESYSRVSTEMPETDMRMHPPCASLAQHSASHLRFTRASIDSAGGCADL